MDAQRKAVILLTGFAPFGGYRRNSSWEAARIAGKRVGADMVVAWLPVHHVRAAQALTALLDQHHPDACLLTGLARGPRLRIERVARRHRALAGPDFPGRLHGAWPVAEIGLALRLAKLPFRVSNNAGSYVCNSTYWWLLNFSMRNGWPRHTAFLHVPPLSARFTAASLARGMQAILRRRIALMPDASGTGRSLPPGSDRSRSRSSGSPARSG